MPTVRFVACLAILTLSAPAAYAQDDICSNLWMQRNSIYAAAGYCFKTARAISVFGDAGCSYDSAYDVPLSLAQRQAINNIVSRERYFGCR